MSKVLSEPLTTSAELAKKLGAKYVPFDKDGNPLHKEHKCFSIIVVGTLPPTVGMPFEGRTFFYWDIDQLLTEEILSERK